MSASPPLPVPSPAHGMSRREQARRLQQQVDRLEAGRWVQGATTYSSGCEALDRLLPGHGFAAGSLVQWQAASAGSGAAGLALWAAWQACRRRRAALVVLDRQERFYPPAAAGWGIDPDRLILIRARSRQDELWALDQVLRCPLVRSAWAPLERLDDRSLRGLQLAVERGGGVAHLVRPLGSRDELVGPATVLRVASLPSASSARHLRVELARCRGQAPPAAVVLQWDEWTGVVCEARSSDEPRALRLAARMAPSATPRRSARA